MVDWSDLRVVAADGLFADTGVALRPPVVRDTLGRVFVVRDPDIASPEPGILIPEEELQAHLRCETWVDVSQQQWSGQLGSLVLVTSRRFLAAAAAAEAPHPRAPSVEFGTGTAWYVCRAEVSRWFLETAQILIDKADVELAWYRDTRQSKSAANIVEWLDQSRYVCRVRSPELKQCYLLLQGFFRLKKDSNRVAAIEEALAREFPDWRAPQPERRARVTGSTKPTNCRETERYIIDDAA